MEAVKPTRPEEEEAKDPNKVHVEEIESVYIQPLQEPLLIN